MADADRDIVVLERLPWTEPLHVLAPFGDEPGAFALLSDGSPGARWSYVARRPSAVFDSLVGLREALGRRRKPPLSATDAPPFTGGVVGLATYEWGAALERSAPQARADPPWPDLTGGRYDSLAAFDHVARAAWAVGRGATVQEASERAADAAALLAEAEPPTAIETLGGHAPCAWDTAYPAAVDAVRSAIAAGEIFQANIARGWTGRLPPGAGPLDLLAVLDRLSPAPFAGYLRLEDRALVSRAPERFLQVSPEGVAATSPIKGTRPRGHTPQEDRRLAEELLNSAKDRAENLMIVDVMRNDLARACAPGTVRVDEFCGLRTFSNVHHLVSTVSGRLREGCDALDLFARAFPPASVTGAPKLQAMSVIARHEPPRGPYCGSLFRMGVDGGFDSSVLIRSLSLSRGGEGSWRWEARAGAGITYDSDAQAEDAEAVAKAKSVLAAFHP